MNTCITCKHHKRIGYVDFCKHPDNCLDMVTGEPQTHLCSFARSKLHGLCGPTGTLHEQADPVAPPDVEPDTYWRPPTLWQRIKAFFVGVGPW